MTRLKIIVWSDFFHICGKYPAASICDIPDYAKYILNASIHKSDTNTQIRQYINASMHQYINV